MNEREHPADAPVRGLKSLLKKPGQTRGKSHKNRVVINEKLNEFFAADYIILIKEECCADFEEECDCCCQEPEMIRLGNCKECRADLTRNLSNNSDNLARVDPRYGDLRNGPAYASGLDCDPSLIPVIRRDHRQPVFGSEESQEEDEEEEEEDEEEEEEEEEEADADEADEEAEDEDEAEKCERDEKVNCNIVNCVTPARGQQQQQAPQQQETLSPPEGYKDVCDEDATLSGEQQQQQQQHLVCSECNYYHRQRTAAIAADDNNEATLETQNGECKRENELVRHGEDNNDQLTTDQAQQTTPDLHQRYLVETITMTTVTERRIVREISEEETRPIGEDEADTANANEAIENTKNISERKEEGDRVRFNESSLRPEEDQQHISAERESSIDQREGSGDPSELSLTFKLGNVSLGLTNSLKPNSAVRQLFPDPRFISPPPAPAKAVMALGGAFEQGPDDVSEAQKFLITTESLRVFDAVKRSKMAGSRSDSSESESSSIKRTIERNALRRSLICKFETTSRKKNIRSKDLTLEERIRQLTCVDQDDDNTGSSASETGIPTAAATTASAATATTISSSIDAVDYETEFPVRTSPSGEERPSRNDGRLCSSGIAAAGANNFQEATTILVQQSSSSSSSSSSSNSSSGGAGESDAHHHHHKHHHHHHQSTYKRITDLFAQKKMVDANLPDLGLGDKATLAKEYASKNSVSKMNSDARKQFLASLAPLSCVSSTGVDTREDYYQLSSKQLTSNNNSSNGGGSSSSAPGNRDSIGYNSDSSYSLEDIEAVLRGEERNYKNGGGPPDVTRGTPTGSGPETCDATTDELRAFVEQDKSRTERLRRRYNETEQEQLACSGSCHRHEDSSFAPGGVERGRLPSGTGEQNVAAIEGECATHNGAANELDEEEDDELNDYGFNRRPSVRGIKPQFESTSEIVRQLRSRSAVPSSIAEKSRASFHGATWPYYEISGETSAEKQANTTFLLAAPILSLEDDDQQHPMNPNGGQHRDSNTINRINTMQKQIDDIYQTIAETAVTVQGTLERGSYLDSTLPRTMPRGAINDSCHRYSHQEQQQQAHSQKNEASHYHDQQQQQQFAGAAPGGRMLRIAGGGDGSSGMTAVYNTLPTKSRHPQTVGTVNYPCGVASIPQQTQQTQSAETTKCYRTMYFVPYNGLSDPTYQNIQRILPPHSSANYADHIERYPYPRNGIQQQQQQQQPQHHHHHYHQQQMGPQTQPRYYTRAVPGGGAPANLHGQPAALHLHLHTQSDDYRYATTPPTAATASMHQHPQTLQIQHHQHLPQMSSYSNVQTVPTYSILAPSRTNGPPAPPDYAYPPHAASRAQAANVQTQTISLSPPSGASSATTCGAAAALLNANYSNGSTAGHLSTASSSSSNSSALSSPTKIQQHQRIGTCTERGVPEGAASAPSHDYTQTNSNSSSHSLSNSFLAHATNVPPPNTQNSVYYAMNV